MDVNDVFAAARSGDDAEVRDDDAVTTRQGLMLALVPGQFVVATVTSVGTDALAHPKSAAAALAQSIGGEGGAARSGGGHRVVVSLKPELSNAGVVAETLRPGSFVSGYVHSVEDHGFVVSTGVAGVTAFLPFAACDGTAGQSGTRLAPDSPPGFPLFATVTAINRAAHTLTLACSAKAVTSAVSSEPSHTIYTVKPGMLVRATVERRLENGLAVTFLAFFHSSIHIAHLPLPAHALWADEPPAPGTTLLARVLYVNASEKVIALSAAPHVVALGGDGSGTCGTGAPDFGDVTDGSIVPAATVLRVDPGVGMLIGWGDGTTAQPGAPLGTRLRDAASWGRTAYVHISRVADGTTEAIERVYRAGATVRARILGFSGVEGTAVATTASSIVDAAVLRATDVRVGALLTGVVEAVPAADDTGAAAIDVAAGKGIVAVVRLGEGATGVISILHAADVLPIAAFRTPKGRAAFLKSAGLTVGAPLSVRVLARDASTGRIQLTLKRSLLSSTLPILTSYQGAYDTWRAARDSGGAPLLAIGTVTGVREAGVIVTFYDGVSGFVHAAELVAAGAVPASAAIRVPAPAGGKDDDDSRMRTTLPLALIASLFSLGQTLRVRVLSVAVSKERMRLTTATAESTGSGAPGTLSLSSASAKVAEAPAAAAPPAGTAVDGIVVAVDAPRSRVIVSITGLRASDGTRSDAPSGPLYGALHSTQLTDEPADAAVPLESLFPIGTRLVDLLVLQEIGSKQGGGAGAVGPRGATPQHPTVLLSAKPLLRAAAHTGGGSVSCASMPASNDEARPGTLVAGYVAQLTAFGAFIRFLADCTGLAPRSKWGSNAGESDEKEPLAVGQTVMAVVESVAVGSGSRSRFVVNIGAAAVHARLSETAFSTPVPHGGNSCTSVVGSESTETTSDATTIVRRGAQCGFLALPLRQQIEAEERNALRGATLHAPVCRALYPPGSVTVGRVTAVRGSAVVLELASARRLQLLDTAAAASNPASDGALVAALASTENAAAAPAKGELVRVRVLDVTTSGTASGGGRRPVLMVQLLPPAAVPAVNKTSGKRNRTADDASLTAPPSPLIFPDHFEAGADVGTAVAAPALGTAVSVRVVHVAANARRAAVELLDGSGAVGLISLDDKVFGIGHVDAPTITVGLVVSAVVTQAPAPRLAAATSKVSSKRSKRDATVAVEDDARSPSIPGIAAAAADQLVLLTAVRSLVDARRLAEGQSTGALNASATAVTAVQQSPSAAVARLVPGATFRAVVRSGSASAHAAHPAPLAAAGGAGLPPIPLRLLDLPSGLRVDVLLPAAECVEFCPYDGSSGGSGSGGPLDQYEKLVRAAPGTELRVKIVSVAVEAVPPATRGSRDAAVPIPTQLYHVAVTTRTADLELPDQHLASQRPAWAIPPANGEGDVASAVAHRAAGADNKHPASAVRVVNPNVVIGASAAMLSAAGPAALAHPALVETAPLVPGALAYGIVEGHASDGSFVSIGLGGGVHARCAALQCGDDDSVRDAATGALHATPAAASALSHSGLISLHPVGSVVPVVILTADTTRRRADVSIRRARGAMAVALAAVGNSSTSKSESLVASSKKRARRADIDASAATLAVGSDASAAFTASTAAVFAWIRASDASERPIPGAIVLAQVVAPPAAHATISAIMTPSGPQKATSEAASDGGSFYRRNATAVHVQIGGGISASRGRVCITHVADRGSWVNAPLAKIEVGTVHVAVVLPAVHGSSAAVRGDEVALSLRPSLIDVARATVHDAAMPPQPSARSSRKRAAAAVTPTPIMPTATETATSIESIEAAEAEAATAIGAAVSGFVVSASKQKGVFVRITRGCTARVLLSRLSDGGFVKDPETAFPCGTLVTGTIVASDPAAARFDLSLRTSDASVDAIRAQHAAGDAHTSKALLTFADLHADLVLDGSVTKVADFGVFVALDGTSRGGRRVGSAQQPISGLVHVSECGSKVNRGALRERFSVGDRVRVVVLEVTSTGAGQHKLAVSMKPSRLAAAEAEAAAALEAVADEAEQEEDVDEDSDASPSENDDDEEEEQVDEAADLRGDGSAEVDEDSNSDDDEEQSQGGANNDDEDDEMEEDDEHDSDDDGNAAAAGATTGIFGVLDDAEQGVPTVGAAGGSRRDGSRVTSAVRIAVANVREVEPVPRDDDDDVDDNEVLADSETTKSRAKRVSRRAAADAAYAATELAEARLVSGEAEAHPESEGDYERLVAAHPHSSVAWVRFMAWALCVTDMAKARAIAERALATISFREETERLNVWTALMSAEMTYGDASSLARVFARAQTAADPKAVHHALIGVYTRAGSARDADAEALFATTAKRFGSDDRTLWPLWARARFGRGDAAGARALLKRAIEVLPARDHVKIMEAFALLEYEFAPGGRGSGAGAGTGSRERGRTMFEGLLSTSPRALDVWAVYIDQEIAALRAMRAATTSVPAVGGAARAGAAADAAAVAAVRRIFDRALTLRLSSKKMKFMIKKYLAFETTYGDAAGVKRVHDTARAYVAAQLAAAAGSEASRDQ